MSRNDPPKNFKVVSEGGVASCSWEPVSGACGYKLFFLDASSPDKCLLARYADGCSLDVDELENGKYYTAVVCALFYENNAEIEGALSDKVTFRPTSGSLIARKALCLKIGEKAKLTCEDNGRPVPVVYSCDNTNVAAVNPSGIVTGLSAGNCRVKMTADDGRSCRTDVFIDRSLIFREEKAVLMFAGDIMCAYGQQTNAANRSFDFYNSFERIKDTLREADFSAGVLEVSCSDKQTFECEQRRLRDGSINRNSPSTFISALADAGFDALVTANNHTFGSGSGEIYDTIAGIRKCGMKNLGTFDDNPVVVEVNGFKIGIVCCTMYSGDYDLDDGDFFSMDNTDGRYDRQFFSELIAKARSMDAEYIVAFQHWGEVNNPNITKQQAEESAYMAAAGADLIVGSHPHIIQPFVFIDSTDDGGEVRRTACAYSPGNFITSMDERRESREGIILRVELARTVNKIDARFSYIPIINEERGCGMTVFPALPSFSRQSSVSAERTARRIGSEISCRLYKRSIMLIGSSMLKSIFEAGGDFAVDDTPLYLSALSLGSSPKLPVPDGDDPRIALEVGKDITGYIKKTAPDFAALDLYTAANVSCYKYNTEINESDCYYTNVKRLRDTGFFDSHAEELVRVRPPYGEGVWKPMIKSFAEKLLKVLPHERIILIRCSINAFRYKGHQLRTLVDKERHMRILHEMEDYFIKLVNPAVIDLSDKYFLEEGTFVTFEKDYYADVYRAALEIASGRGRSYIGAPDLDIWFSRVIKFYDNMTARNYQRRLLDMNNAADKLIAGTSAKFAARYGERIKKLKKAGKSELQYAADFFAGDVGAEELIRAAEIIDTLEKGEIERPYSFFALAFDENFSVLRKMIKLLQKEVDIPVNRNNVETVFLLRKDALFEQYEELVRDNTVDVWGSGAARESVNACKDAFINKYIYRQPQILAFEPPMKKQIPEGVEMYCNNEWRRDRLVEAFRKEGLNTIGWSRANWIVIDFYDLISPMCEYNGTLFETDDFIYRTEFYKSINHECTPCYLFEKRDMRYCSDAVSKFAEAVKGRYGKNIILIKLEPKDEFITQDYRLEQMYGNSMHEIKTKFIALCEKKFIDITECYVIDIAKRFYASDDYPYGGVNICHYENEFYRQTAEHISSILRGSGSRSYTDVDDNYILRRELKLSQG